MQSLNILPLKVVETPRTRHRPCQFLGRARDPKQPQRNSQRVNVRTSHRTEKSFPLFLFPPSLPLLFQLGKNICPDSGPNLADLGPAQAHSLPHSPPGGSRTALGATAKVTGASEHRGKETKTQHPATCTFPQQNSSEINLYRQRLLQNFPSPNMKSPGTSPTAPQRLPTPKSTDAPTSIGNVCQRPGKIKLSKEGKGNKNSSFLGPAVIRRPACLTWGHVAHQG